MKNRPKIGISMIMAFMLICVVLPTNAVAETIKETVYIGGISEDEVHVITQDLDEGVKIEWDWETSGGWVDFQIGVFGEFSPQVSEEEEDFSEGSFTTHAEGLWEIKWTENGLELGADSIELTLSITFGDDVSSDDDDDTSDDDTTDDDKKESNDSPGFELFGVVFAIGLCIAVIGWRKRK